MSLKAIVFSLGCLLAWFVLLPLLLIGVGTALFCYAIFAELGVLLVGNTKSVDSTVAREIARSICEYGVQPRNMRRRAASENFDAVNGVTGPTSTSS
jgi:hypothetical protein